MGRGSVISAATESAFRSHLDNDAEAIRMDATYKAQGFRGRETVGVTGDLPCTILINRSSAFRVLDVCDEKGPVITECRPVAISGKELQKEDVHDLDVPILVQRFEPGRSSAIIEEISATVSITPSAIAAALPKDTELAVVQVLGASHENVQQSEGVKTDTNA